jgi:hypothetical protein
VNVIVAAAAGERSLLLLRQAFGLA